MKRKYDVVVIGAGYVSFEFGHAAAAAGAKALINVVAMAVRHRMTDRDLREAIFAYPSSVYELNDLLD